MPEETTVVPVPEPAPKDAPAPDAATAPAAAPKAAPATAPASSVRARGPGRGRRATAIVGQAAGIIGIIVSLALVVGVLYVRGWGTDKVTAVAATVDSAIARTGPRLETAAATVDDIAQRVGEVATAAETVALDPNATPAALQDVLDRLSAVSDRYLELRTAYAGAREQIVSVLDRIALVDQLIPGVSLPQGPVDALASLDEKARALDAQIMELIDAGLAVQAVNRAAASIADRAHQVEARLEGLAGGITDVGVRLEQLRAEIADIASNVNTAITILSAALILLLLYTALLHWVLIRASRRYARGFAI